MTSKEITYDKKIDTIINKLERLREYEYGYEFNDQEIQKLRVVDKMIIDLDYLKYKSKEPSDIERKRREKEILDHARATPKNVGIYTGDKETQKKINQIRKNQEE